MLQRYPSLSATLLALFFLAACGGEPSGGGNDVNSPASPPLPPPSAGLTRLQGQVTAPAGVDIQSLAIVAPGVASTLDTNGSFTADVHSNDVSLLIAMFDDKDFGLMGIVINPENTGQTSINLTAESTAIGMVFSSPLLIRSDPTDAESLVAAIAIDSTLPYLVSAIEQAIGNPDPMESHALVDAFRTTVASVADSLGSAAPSQEGQLGAVRNKRLPVLRLTKLDSFLDAEVKTATSVLYEIDPSFFNYLIFSAELSNSNYLIDAESKERNAVDWYAEVAEVDASQFETLADLESHVQNKLSLYPRIPSSNAYIGNEIVYAKGALRWIDLIEKAVDGFADYVFGTITTDGIAVPRDKDAVYVLRGFSSGITADVSERAFVVNDLPNGVENEFRARLVNSWSIILELVHIFGIPLESDCTTEALGASFVTMYHTMAIDSFVGNELETLHDMVRDALAAAATCIVHDAGSGAIRWILKLSEKSKGLLNIPVTGAILAERVSSIIFSSTPLESAIVVVGNPAFVDVTPPAIPDSVVAQTVSDDQIDLSWAESADNDTVTEYRIYRDSQHAFTTNLLSVSDIDLSSNTQYCYTVTAVDASGNESLHSSPPVCATTPATAPDGFVKIVDSNTVLPSNGTMECYPGVGHSIDGNRIAFRGTTTSQALYVSEAGEIRIIADASTMLPGLFTSATNIYDFAVDGTKTYFTTNVGLYEDDGGSLSVVVESSMPVPGSTLKFGGVYGMDAGNGVVAFLATHDLHAHAGIYAMDADGIRTVANIETVNPVTETAFSVEMSNHFSGYSIDVDGGQIAFTVVADDTDPWSFSLFVDENGVLKHAADEYTLFPNGRSGSPHNPTVDAMGRVFFISEHDDAQTLVYSVNTWQSGILSLYKDHPFVEDGTTKQIIYGGGYSAADPSQVVLRGVTSEVSGLYAFRPDAIKEIINTNESLDGKQLAQVWTGDLDEGLFVILAEFDDGSCGLYARDINLIGSP